MTTVLTRLSPPQWRLINYFEYDRQPWYSLPAAMHRQGINWPDITELDAAELVRLHTAQVRVRAADLNGGIDAMRLAYATVHPTPASKRLALETVTNRVICMLGRQPNRTYRASYLKAEAGVDDQTLIEMGRAQLLDGADGVPLSSFSRLPNDLKIRLASKARRYVPR